MGALEKVVAEAWALDATTVVTHGGGWGDENADRQLAKGMQIGRLWGAEQGEAEVRIRRRAVPDCRRDGAPVGADNTLEMVMGYAGAPKHERWQYSG